MRHIYFSVSLDRILHIWSPGSFRDDSEFVPSHRGLSGFFAHN